MESKQVFFIGKVQGVYFRENAMDKAIELNLNGFVRNLSNGQVEMIVQGNKKKIDNLIEFCKNNQPYAKVNNLNVKTIDINEKYSNFIIEKTKQTKDLK
jgi:acylphosphatase